MVAHVRFGIIRLPKDPTLDMCGWTSVARELDRRGLLNQPHTFLFTDHWYDSGQLAFAVRNRYPVLCYNTDGAASPTGRGRRTGSGRTGCLFASANARTTRGAYKRYFQRVELVAEFPMTRNGDPLRRVRVYRCVHQFQPFPFRQ